MTAGEPRSFGVEEELVLIDPDTRRATARSDRAEAANESGEEVALELFRHQVESSTPPLTDAGELGEALRRGRRALGESAAAAGARAVATASPPLAPGEEEFTRTERYLRFEGEFGQIARESHVCGMHVHVGIEDAEGIRVIDGIRPWLPVLTAISANSPYWQGTDTGYASWRSQVWGRWSSAGAREPFGDVDTYREVAERTIAWGGAMDRAMLYFDARLAENYPTVELRVCDVCLEIEDAVLVAVLARALVTTAAATREVEAWRSDLLRVAGWRAARYGTAGPLVHPGTRELASAREVFAALLEAVGPALDETGERRFVDDGFERVLARGNGAVRQRRTFEETRDLVAVVDDLADATETTWL
ncbi:glutamate--cysteine ligase [Marmoricola sp. URHB0036]|uniref:carboxylate-amine ligase n=1 Tax=Marmoricola sp. URHB0036 TaxID=1298863 RepID=UPI00040339A2|nr:glutamate--cysteine ligase [Marmoricola sp. URHB0036]